MSDLVTVGLFVLLALVVLIYRRDATRAAERRTAQNEQWGQAQTKVVNILDSTQRLLEEQQRANKILEDHNAKLSNRIEEIKAELTGVRAELAGLRKELEQMTKRAQAAEEKIGPD